MIDVNSRPQLPAGDYYSTAGAVDRDVPANDEHESSGNSIFASRRILI